MTLRKQIMKLQTYKMYEGEDTVYVERDDVLKALEQEPCEDCISRAEALKHSHIEYDDDGMGHRVIYAEDIEELPSVTPKFTDTEIQKMQELEQAQLDKAYELGKAEIQPSEDCISREAVIDIIDFEDK